ncbi:MAG: hypothetical protein WA715_03645, partial [Candidatus Acidiferrum sp.]
MAKAKAKEMMRVVVAGALVGALALGGATASYAGPADAEAAASAAKAGAAAGSVGEFKVPVEYYKLANGLRVVMSPDHT